MKEGKKEREKRGKKGRKKKRKEEGRKEGRKETKEGKRKEGRKEKEYGRLIRYTLLTNLSYSDAYKRRRTGRDSCTCCC